MNKDFPIENRYQSEIYNCFGRPGENQVLVDMPFPLKLSWSLNQTINRFYCHEKVKDNFRYLYDGILKEYGLEYLQSLNLDIWGGCFNVRKKRGGTTFSLHSWGIAIDIDPSNNKLKWKDTQAQLALPAYHNFWKIVEDAGLVGLGKKKNFDWMHIQATK